MRSRRSAAWRGVVGVAGALVGSALLCGAEEAAKTGKWASSVAVGASVTDGNSKTRTLNGSGVASRETEHDAVRFGVEGNYGETEVEVTQADGTIGEDMDTNVQNAKGYVSYKRLFGRPYLYTDDSVSHDKIANLDYRLIAGVGPGYLLVSTDRTKFGVEVGGAYVKEEYADDAASDDFFALRASQRLDHKLSATAKLWEAVEYVPEASDTDNYLLNAEVGIEATMTERTGLRLVFQDRYDSTPAEGNKANDLSVIAAINYRLM